MAKCATKVETESDLSATALPMELKRIEDLTWDDLPGVESSFFAHTKVRWDCDSLLAFSHSTIRGVESALNEYVSSQWYSSYHEHPKRAAVGWLLEQVTCGKYIVVRKDYSWNMDSVLRWDRQGRLNDSGDSKNASHPVGSQTARNGIQQSSTGGQKNGVHPEVDPAANRPHALRGNV
jgi:hypothetical protein